MDLQECRRQLDGIDQQLVELFEKRMKICGNVAEYKIATGKPVFDGERERQKLAAVAEQAHGEYNQPPLSVPDDGRARATGEPGI